MIIKGTQMIAGVSREAVFDALSDPAVLARTLPGCRELTDRGDGIYDVSIYAGAGSVRGTYSGRVSIGARRRPELYEAVLEASGAPGTVTASLRAELSNGESGTDVAYEMDAKVAGRIAGVGQRVISGVSRKNATAFFAALEDELTGSPASEPTAGQAPAAEGQVTTAAPSGRHAMGHEGSEAHAAAVPRTYLGRPPEPFDAQTFASGVAVGILLTLLVRWRRR